MKIPFAVAAFLALLAFTPATLPAQEDEETVTKVGVGYEKIDLPASVASTPKPVAPEDPTSVQLREYNAELRKWREKEKENKAKRDAAKKASEAMLRGGARDKSMENYFNLIHFPLMTQSFANIVKDRKYVTDELAQAARSASGVRAELLKLSVDWCKKLAEGNYAPATRVNAVLLLGELNDVEGKVPVPHRPALKYLLELSENPSIPVEVRQAALVGVQRHLELDNLAAAEKANNRIPKADLDAVIEKMLALVSAKSPPENVDRKAFTLMQRRAASILGAYGQVGENNKVYDALVNVVADDEASLWVRSDAAIALGRLNYNEAQVDSAKGARSLGALVAYAANEELETLKKQSESGGAVGGGGYGGPGMGRPGMGGPRGGGPSAPGGGAGLGAPGGAGPGAPVGGGPSSPGPGGLAGGGGRFGGGGAFGGMGGGSGTYYPENLVTPMIRRMLAIVTSAQIGLDGANGRGAPGLRKPRQDVALDRIAENIEKLKGHLVRLQKKQDAQSEVFREFRLAIVDVEAAAGVKKKAGAAPANPQDAPTDPGEGGQVGGN